MAVIRELEIKLNDWEARYVLESLSKEMERLKTINTQSEDEDEAADAGNDFMEISSLYENVSKNAVEIFGEQILNFGREQL
ncbi:hypothetical protein [Thalassolituus oleivorans]|uniref:hypothetical protein n=1 Tax=Thalassolituus oleivorans TaxID=187493 RepID=UPI0023F31189|nr:hypothetical protein [Thalassolituus oleivorans]